MRSILLSLLLTLSSAPVFSQAAQPAFVTTDIDHFWEAYDQITATKDTVRQYELLNRLYIEKGSPGLRALMEVRDYTPKSYLDAIRQYPRFWQSVRPNTRKAAGLAREIDAEIAKLKQLYPALKPAPVYFTIGALRTGGTTQNGMVLIGSEIALADQNTVTTEFPKNIAEARSRYFVTNPIHDVVLLNVHEYVHTQQKPIVHNLLSEVLYEGVAEFVSVTATGKPSSTPAVAFGKANTARVMARFEYDMFRSNKQGQWLWSDQPNTFQVRDLGYYVGYAICEWHYQHAKDKQLAIREMIELDYENEAQVEKFVDDTKLFSQPLSALYRAFEQQRPRVVGIRQFPNGSQQVDPRLTQLTIEFSTPMDANARGFELGPLGEDAALRISKFIGFSEDGKSATFEVALQPNRRYQLVPSYRFRTEDGLPLGTYLIDFRTAAN